MIKANIKMDRQAQIASWLLVGWAVFGGLCAQAGEHGLAGAVRVNQRGQGMLNLTLTAADYPYLLVVEE